MWDPAHIVFESLFVSEQAIHGKVRLPNELEVCVSFIYGLCDSGARKSLWYDIIYCSNQFKNVPWILLGDFNVTRFCHEHSVNCRVTEAMEDFNSAIRTAELEDLRSTGLSFTWNNMRCGAAAISKKLDRAMGNWKWFNCFGDSFAHYLNPGISDHSPISIQLMQHTQSSGRPFKFLNFWADHEDFLPMIAQEWGKVYTGAPVKVIQLKLKALKGQLRSISTRPDTVVEVLRQRLNLVQIDLDANPEMGHLKSLDIQLRRELSIAVKNEESFCKKKIKNSMAKGGRCKYCLFSQIGQGETIQKLHCQHPE
ncbi:Exo_endo_phos domain-containing protein [Cephalotus follicularis]|uniref:Exo_endo_phos domain-containing protein n=1 Tax=Cephalotus follicularis TaxID=3775 RepID=A0A1Q3DI07_CEPFO|nr:Exo_endo_phos domain-containing protein [Cephalotus follicularis]